MTNEKQNHKTGVCYFRYSPGGNQTFQSIEGQRTVCMRYAHDNGINIVDTYIDEYLTGTNDRRPAFQKMLKDSNHCKWDFVIVYDIERFGRNKEEIVINKKLLRENGTLVLCATQITSYNVDGSRNLSGILLEGLHESYAEYYSAELSQKVRRGQNESIQKRQFLGGFVTYGYKVIDKQYCIDEPTANVVRTIFNMYNSGMIIDKICEYLKDNQFYNQKNRVFLNTQVIRILQDEKYIGIFSYGNYRVEDYLPPIITKEVFMKAQERFKRNKRLSGGYKAKEPYILTTKLVCGNCGSNMLGETGTSKTKKKYHYYKCFEHKKHGECKVPAVAKDWIENFVVQETVKFLFENNNTNSVAKELFELNNRLKKLNSNLDIYKKQIQERQTAINNLVTAIEQGIIAKGTKERLLKLENEKDELEKQLAIEQSVIDKDLPEDMIVYYLEQLRNGDIADFEYKYKIIDMLVEKVFLYSDKVVIVYKFDDNGGKKEIALDEINDFLNMSAEEKANSTEFVYKTVPSAKTKKTTYTVFFCFPKIK